VRFPENFEQFAKTDDGRIKSNLYNFGMTGFASANFLVSGVLQLSARVARLNGFNPFQTFKNGFGTPKAAASKSSRFGLS
jgi:hypothetical protein